MTSKSPKKHSKSVKEQSSWNCADLIDAERRNALNALPKSIVAQSKKLSKLRKELNRLKLSLIGHPITPANESLVDLHQSFIAKLPFKDELEIFRKFSAQFQTFNLLFKTITVDPKKTKPLKIRQITDSKLSLIGYLITPANESLVGLHQNFIAKLPFKDELEIFRKFSAQFQTFNLLFKTITVDPKKTKPLKIRQITDSNLTPFFNEKPTQDQNPSPISIIVLPNSSTNPPKQASSSVKREHNKLQTRERHKTWQKEYKKLKRKHPNLPDTEIARRIAKMTIAQDRKMDTIRKHMTK